MKTTSSSFAAMLPSVTESAREAELVATFLVKFPAEIPKFIKQRRWSELAAFADYVSRDVPRNLAKTDPALYRTLRNGVTSIMIMGFGNMDGDFLRSLAAKDAAASSAKTPAIKASLQKSKPAASKRAVPANKKSGKIRGQRTPSRGR